MATLAFLVLGVGQAAALGKERSSKTSLALVGHVLAARNQPVLAGEDSFEDWSVYDFQIEARPAGGSFGDTGGPGKILPIYVQSPLGERGASLPCPSPDSNSDLYLVFLTRTIGRGRSPQPGIYLLDACAKVDRATMLGFLKD